MEKGHEFGIWDVRSLYRPGSLTTGARGLQIYKLDLFGTGSQVRQRVYGKSRGL